MYSYTSLSFQPLYYYNWLTSLSSQADKLRAQQQLEALQARYVGTGHADTTKFEWTSNIQRDSYASYVGHPPLLSYMAIGMGECREKVRAQMVEKMIQPVGKPPESSD
jgi:splicing factor 3B subunit 5